VTSSSSLATIAAGLDDVAAEATRIEAAQLELDAALSAVRVARTTFQGAFADFAETIPATASALIVANPDAGQEWRDAVAAAVTALAAALKSGPGAEELQAYGAAAFALQDENARVLAEEEAAEGEGDTPRQTPRRPRTGTDGNEPPAARVKPGVPNPNPNPDPEPEPDPLPEIPKDPL
ncbi:MAG: hypothetical protein ABWX92_04955, partial [Mycetocola sp.]